MVDLAHYAVTDAGKKEKQRPGKIKTKTDVSIFGNIPSPPLAIEKLGEKRGGGWGKELEYWLGGGKSLRGEAVRKGVHYGTKPGHFKTSKIHIPTSKGVSEVSERANE